MAERGCARCGKPVEVGRRRYCSDACADSATRERIKLRKIHAIPRRTYRYYPKAERGPDAERP